jgi:hypothetical protein
MYYKRYIDESGRLCVTTDASRVREATSGYCSQQERKSPCETCLRARCNDQCKHYFNR